MGCEIVKVYRDHGISGAKGRDMRPQFDALCRDATQRRFDVIMAWSVDRLGRSLQDLVAFLLKSMRFGSSSTCISKAWTPRRRLARRCFR
jgi:DNA invertase Pin-like site-specific DNA recombinase